MKPNYRITIIPDSRNGPDYHDFVDNHWNKKWYWKWLDFEDCELKIDDQEFLKCFGIPGYHPDSSKLKK